MSAHNIAAILAGLPQGTIAPPTNLAIGPRGIPVPNPNYHP